MSKVLSCIVIDCRSMDECLYRDVLSRLSDDRRALAESFRCFTDRVMSAVAGYCMESLADSLDTKVVKLPNGKPVFERDDMHLSVSHSGGLVAIAWSDGPVGVDVQESRSMGNIASRILSPKESALSDTILLSIWAAKESYVKMTGEGLSKDFRDITVYLDGEFVSPDPGYAFHHFEPCDGFVLQLCGESEVCPSMTMGDVYSLLDSGF
ncbi:MAG: 4'-phosphopantetheinyl transferase superfamily protein [Thermoplasmata archaeon]|nr:4'-phosphopantetheinyl transferase superfamily protein [Thermoplasmata archaeon]